MGSPDRSPVPGFGPVPGSLKPFYRPPGADAAPGAGLGLALVKQIAERHGGTAICRERECGGTVFEVTLRDAAKVDPSVSSD